MNLEEINTVYIVVESQYDGSIIHQVFSSKEKALTYIKKQHPAISEDLEIEEYRIDIVE